MDASETSPATPELKPVVEAFDPLTAMLSQGLSKFAAKALLGNAKPEEVKALEADVRKGLSAIQQRINEEQKATIGDE